MRFQNTAATGNITKLEMEFSQLSGNGSVMLGVYADSGGTPGALLGSGQTSAGPDWVSVNGLNIAVTLNTYYWLAFDMSANNAVEYQGRQAAGSHAWANAAYGPLPSSFPAIRFTNSDQDVMRATVSPGAAQIQYSLSVNRTGQCSVTKSPNKPFYNPGDIVTLIANPASGWNFSDWTGDLRGNTSTANITMTGNKVVTAVFARQAPQISQKPAQSQSTNISINTPGTAATITKTVTSATQNATVPNPGSLPVTSGLPIWLIALIVAAFLVIVAISFAALRERHHI